MPSTYKCVSRSFEICNLEAYSESITVSLKSKHVSFQFGSGIAAQGPFTAENCQNPDKNFKFGVSSFRHVHGIMKIDLVQKKRAAFINTTPYCGPYEIWEIASTSVKKYAIVKCEKKKAMVIIDVVKEKVVHWNDSMTINVIGHPIASPDGKYILIAKPGRVNKFSNYFHSCCSSLMFIKF